MYNPVETGNRIRECRQTKHLAQEQAAEALSISIKHYSEIERGITGLSFEIFIKICELYSISADFLLFGQQEELSPQLLRKLNNCPPKKKNQILSILQSVLEL